jgi:hypothetical protein
LPIKNKKAVESERQKKDPGENLANAELSGSDRDLPDDDDEEPEVAYNGWKIRELER